MIFKKKSKNLQLLQKSKINFPRTTKSILPRIWATFWPQPVARQGRGRRPAAATRRSSAFWVGRTAKIGRTRRGSDGRDTLHSRPGTDGGGRHHRECARVRPAIGVAAERAILRRTGERLAVDCAPRTKDWRGSETQAGAPAPHRLSLSVLCTSRSAAASPIPPHFCKITRKSSSSISVSLSPILCWFLSFPQRFCIENRSRLCAAPRRSPCAYIWLRPAAGAAFPQLPAAAGRRPWKLACYHFRQTNLDFVDETSTRRNSHSSKLLCEE